MKTNCFVFAWRAWRYGSGDAFVIRKSHWGWFPHFSVIYELHDGTVVKKEYKPTNPKKQRFPPLFFIGEEVTTIYRKIGQCDGCTGGFIDCNKCYGEA